MKSSKIIILIIVIIFIALLVWLFIASTKPLPGVEAKQDGRDHVPEGSKVDYTFNPPTSGNHYASWIAKGFYEEPRADGNLVHSMEHGYIIVWYDCERKLTGYRPKVPLVLQLTGNVYAQTQTMTQGSEGSPSATLKDMPKVFSDGSCSQLSSELRNYFEKDKHKIIVMPRVGMDAPIVLTAWGRMEKLNSLDQPKIKAFIEAYRDNGPEQTTEP